MNDQDHMEFGEQLAQEVAEEIGGRRSVSWRCPAELQSRILTYIQLCFEKGETIRVISRRLGMVEKTLRRWLPILEAEDTSGGFREVSLVSSTASMQIPPTLAIRLNTPNGYVVEGLDVESLVHLLEVLG